MATYKEIRGTNIEVVSSDPSNSVTGQVWFNSTDNVVKGNSGPLAGAWATGNDLGTARYSLAGAGTQTASLAFGGGPPLTGATELYNGTNWTEKNDLGTSRATLAGSGTSTAALAFGGFVPPGATATGKTETWNGTNWTETADLNTARRQCSGCEIGRAHV